MKYVFRDEAGLVTDVSVRIQRVSHLLTGQVRAHMQAKRPAVPQEDIQMPDGTTKTIFNQGHPQYKLDMADFQKEVEAVLIQRYIEEGVHPDDLPLVDGRTEAQRSTLAGTIRRVSFVSNESVQQAAMTADPLVIEAMAAARWGDVKFEEFFKLSVDHQSLIVLSYRTAMAAAQASRPRELPPTE